ncbi:MAG: hypothetical protein AAF986_11510, partial [Pseudomonadota bacterium]
MLKFAVPAIAYFNIGGWHLFLTADFSSKKRCFDFSEGNVRADVGHSHGYWTVEGDRQCNSEVTTDLAGNVYETYFFSQEGIGDASEVELFNAVKNAHTDYTHDPDMRYIVSSVRDDSGAEFWSVDICIADAKRLFRRRPPFFSFYDQRWPKWRYWPVWQEYINAQREEASFLLIQGETGSASWRDNTVYNTLMIHTVGELRAKLSSLPNKCPTDDY